MKNNDFLSSSNMRVFDDILGAIGNTPLVRLRRLGRDLACLLYAKVEFFNPGGSVKDRIAVNIITEAEQSGRLKPGGTVVEATSGNTGVGLAIVCAQKGYRTVFVLPDKMSQEKIQLLRAFGAKVVITPTAVAPEDPRSYYNVAKRIVAETHNAILANQYHNPENPRSHYLTTGPEIWEQTQGKVTDIIIGMGTGGTISGVGRFLKEKNPEIRVIGVDPIGSLLLDTWKSGQLPPNSEALPYKVEGIGEDFLPSTLDLSIIDEVIQIGDRESFKWARRLVKEEGIFCGGSSGTALAAAMQYASRLSTDRFVVVLLPDSGSRYLSKFYDDKWMKENGFLETEWGAASLAEILATRPNSELITVQMNDRIPDVINVLKAHDISQAPVLNPDGTLAGLVAEVDLLKYLLENDPHQSMLTTIAGIASPAQAVFSDLDSIESALPSIIEGYVAIITRDDRPIGILTKIDLLDYLAQML